MGWLKQIFLRIADQRKVLYVIMPMKRAIMMLDNLFST